MLLPVWGLPLLMSIFSVAAVQAKAAERSPPKLRFYFEDRFSAPEQHLLRSWIEGVQAGVDRLVGPLPYRAHVHLHRSERGGPVPWAHTVKYPNAAVHFYVNPALGRRALVSDWTAAHELAHLLFPYLGEDSRWFAEGIASYLQYQIMALNGVRDWPSVIAKLNERFDRARRSDRGAGLSIPAMSTRLKETGGHVRMYWGGAAFFLHADQTLYQRTLDLGRPQRLVDLIRDYVACCWKLWGEDGQSMIDRFDALSDTTVFRDTYESQMMTTKFPDTAAAERWLAEHPPAAIAAALAANDSASAATGR